MMYPLFQKDQSVHGGSPYLNDLHTSLRERIRALGATFGGETGDQQAASPPGLRLGLHFWRNPVCLEAYKAQGTNSDAARNTELMQVNSLNADALLFIHKMHRNSP